MGQKVPPCDGLCSLYALLNLNLLVKTIIAENVKASLRHSTVSLQLRGKGLAKVNMTTYTTNLPQLLTYYKDF